MQKRKRLIDVVTNIYQKFSEWLTTTGYKFVHSSYFRVGDDDEHTALVLFERVVRPS